MNDNNKFDDIDELKKLAEENSKKKPFLHHLETKIKLETVCVNPSSV